MRQELIEAASLCIKAALAEQRRLTEGANVEINREFLSDLRSFVIESLQSEPQTTVPRDGSALRKLFIQHNIKAPENGIPTQVIEHHLLQAIAALRLATNALNNEPV